jgi:hypothetical protein
MSVVEHSHLRALASEQTARMRDDRRVVVDTRAATRAFTVQRHLE